MEWQSEIYRTAIQVNEFYLMNEKVIDGSSVMVQKSVWNVYKTNKQKKTLKLFSCLKTLI